MQKEQFKLSEGQKKLNKTQCFKCFGQGHFAKYCEANVLNDLDEHYVFVCSN